MMNLQKMGGLVISTVLGILISASIATGQTDSAAVAEINGQKVTGAQLEQRESGKLLQARYQYYQAQRKALDDFVDEYLLEAEARRENVTVEQLLDLHVKSQVRDPTEDQLQVYYEGVGTDEPFTAVRAKILESIRQGRIAKARAVYIKTLRDENTVRILLAPPVSAVALGAAATHDTSKASVLLVEYADYECPYCQKVHFELKKLQAEFGGRLSFVYKDFPLPMHPRAEKAAEAARCAGAQGKFLEFHDLIFSSKQLELAQLKEHARTLQLDTISFNKCLDSGEQAAAVQKDLAEGQSLGLSGTPSFFLNGRFFSGAVDYAAMREMVERELTESPAVLQSAANASAAATPASKQ